MVVLISRFGVGQCQPEFYEQNFPLLKNIFLASLSNSQNKTFILVLMLDKRIPDKYLRLIKNSIPRDIAVVLNFHDPFLYFTMHPDYDEIIRSIDGHQADDLTVVRIDSDDAISRNFIDVLETKMLGLRGRNPSYIAFNPISGAHWWPETGVGYCIRKLDYSVQALSCSKKSKFLHIYTFSHKNIGEKIHNLGGESMIIQTDAPLWLRTLHSGSDTNNILIRLAANVPFIGELRNVLHFLGLRKNSKTLWGPRIDKKRLMELFGVDAKAFFKTGAPNSLAPLPESCQGYPLIGKTRLYRKQEILALAEQAAKERGIGCMSEFIRIFYSF